MFRLQVSLLSLALVVMTATSVLAQQSAYSIMRWTIMSTGASSGAGYRLSATAGQAEEPTPITGNAYTLAGGYQHGAASGGAFGGRSCNEGKPCIFLPLVGDGQ